MRLDPLESPRLFPDFVSCSSARLVDGDHRQHFAAGRECAARAMAQLDLPPGAIERGPAGEPLWPAGVTGSITHKRYYVSAAVARTTDVLSIGIDAEEILSESWAARVAPVVLLPSEVLVGGSEMAQAVRVSLFFSIKEAVFKCLYPIVRTRFYYDAVAVTAVNPSAGTFVVRLQRALSMDHPEGATLSGRWARGGSRVFAALFIPAEQPSG